ncbi:hypothetical protein TWF730_004624 [Orbilia blumenaviensis]|uniref:Uncharacterized protein n=1 Tax=Orbilia blumenaviensis TaxID=1796055 RepID=A0AAV9TVV3_9PEZI
MSFLRALSSDSLSSSSRSGANQTQSFTSNSSSTNNHNTHPQTNQAPTTGGGGGGGGHRRHHAKALLHPMSLLLRRRSGQSNHGISEPPSGTYGLARDLPDDFDPGIIYGTRHPDWSFPRRSAPTPTQSILRPENRVQGNPLTSGTGSSPRTKDPVTENTHSRKRQAFFTEHFSDLDTDSRPRRPEQDLGDVQPCLAETLGVPSAKADIRGHAVGGNATRPISVLKEDVTENGINPPEDQSSRTVEDDLAQGQLVAGDNNDVEEPSSNPATRYSDISLDPLHNSSRFSFEASSAAESVRGEELTLSENIIQKSQYRPHIDGRRRSYDSISFNSDDINSITSEDLRDEDGDGFTATFSDFPQNIAPPPGFENVVVDALENARRLHQIGVQEQSDDNPPPTSPSDASVGSSEIGVNGSTTEEEGEGEEGGGREEEFDSNYSPHCPPFINPPGSVLHGLVTWDSQGVAPLAAYENSEEQSSPILTFHNIFQTAAQGVNEYDSGSPSSFLGVQSLQQSRYNAEFIDEETGIGDEEDMIAEANRDALAYDSDGWYGQEFDFYPSSSTNSTYLAGGFFGIDLPKPGFIRNPSLTPISERSEGSLRNSLSIINPGSIPNGGVSAGPLSTALFTELAKSEQLSCDETTLSQLQLLGGSKHTDETVKHLTLISSNASVGAPATSLFDGSRASVPPADQPPSSGFDESICHHPGDISTSYVHDTDLGWVMEKRRGGELIQRELVQGAV